MKLIILVVVLSVAAVIICNFPKVKRNRLKFFFEFSYHLQLRQSMHLVQVTLQPPILDVTEMSSLSTLKEKTIPHCHQTWELFLAL